eukprot:8487496-Pyramimonas_sp.AAC.1
MVRQQKKAFKQNGWEHMCIRSSCVSVAPELRPICRELMGAIMSKPRTIRKPGAPPRGGQHQERSAGSDRARG